MSWLRTEANTLEGHMTLGCDFATVITFHALGKALLDVVCDHLENLSVTDVDHYCWLPLVANSIGKKFFEEFWQQGQKDMAMMKGACSHAQVSMRLALAFLAAKFWASLCLKMLSIIFVDRWREGSNCWDGEPIHYGSTCSWSHEKDMRWS